MQNKFLRKGLVVGIIILLIGISINSSIGKINVAISKTSNDGSLLGYVNDSAGNPVEGALVRVHFHESFEEDYSDEDGYYHVTNIPICYCLKNTTCSKEGYITEWILIGIAENTTQDFVLIPGNNPPEAPDIKGPITSKPGILYDYIFKATDPDGDDVRYFIDWDDGNTEWTEYCPSGEEIIVSHLWEEGKYHQIRARANDTHGALGPWGTIQWSKDEDCIECQHNGTLCIIYLFLRNRAYFVLLRLEIHLAFLYGFGLINLLYIYVNFIYIPQYNKILYYEEKLVEYDCGVPPLPI
ncbi:hypothetical protein AYK24_08480 [Thermoplasmatales archaeon SG8-52-4]|nr:MAG: hypothetical protein AYK24_08480 [Thermoplasmatales archaeon SG8-52-4]